MAILPSGLKVVEFKDTDDVSSVPVLSEQDIGCTFSAEAGISVDAILISVNSVLPEN